MIRCPRGDHADISTEKSYLDPLVHNTGWWLLTICACHCSLKSVFGKRGSIKGCLRTIKAMRSFVQMKTMKSAGISYGCTDDLLVSCIRLVSVGLGIYIQFCSCFWNMCSFAMREHTCIHSVNCKKKKPPKSGVWSNQSSNPGYISFFFYFIFFMNLWKHHTGCETLSNCRWSKITIQILGLTTYFDVNITSSSFLHLVHHIFW